MKYKYKIDEIYNLMQVKKIYRKSDRLYVDCKCINCGKLKTLRASDLYNNKTNSCRCQVIKHGMNRTKIYSIYHNMKDRCLNPNNHAYNNYGSRGINICEDWLNENGFINFYNWSISNGYQEGLSIDRINIEGNYKPTNCRWITVSENVALSNVQHPRVKKKK
ncbi:hypothetical protein [Anaerofustis sp.]|uniref:hypothetical protein n=1 Tax=Anaerofustis sp. TaxID=1872517 RepID=UPI0025B7C380|nr:hypothetical protein [Anaerofustis sp.]